MIVQVETTTVTGAVLKPGVTVLPSSHPTLQKLIASAGGVVADKDVNDLDLEMLVILQRDDQTFYINSTAIENTECGQILIKPGETIEVLSWTKSDLFRGLKIGEPSKLAIPPKDTGNIDAVFEWYKASSKKVTEKNIKAINEAKSKYAKAVALQNFARNYTATVPVEPEELKAWGKQFIDSYTILLEERNRSQKAILPDVPRIQSIYGIQAGTKDVSVEVNDERGKRTINQFSKLVNLDDNPITVPTLDNFRGKTGLGTLAVMELQRNFAGKNSTYLLSLEGKNSKGTYTPVGTMLTNACIFDGDRITLTLPSEIPIVKASLVMAQLKKAAK